VISSLVRTLELALKVVPDNGSLALISSREGIDDLSVFLILDILN